MRYIIAVLVISGMVSACGDSQSLGGGYFLSNSDSDHQYIYKKEKRERKLVVDQQIVDWERIGNYIAVLRMVAASPDCYDERGRATIVTHYSSEKEFWIIDIDRRVEFGPLNARDYQLRASRLRMPFPDLTAPPSYRSNTNNFRDIIKRCKRVGNHM